MDPWGNLLPIAVGVFFFAAFLRRLGRRVERGRAAAAPSPAPRPVRRRLSEPPVAAPVTVGAAARPPIVPAMADMLSAEAAAAFPALDLSLGDSGAPAGAPGRRRRRTIGATPIGSRGWGANAVVAAEVLGTPVGLRAGATVGVPHAF